MVGVGEEFRPSPTSEVNSSRPSSQVYFRTIGLSLVTQGEEGEYHSNDQDQQQVRATLHGSLRPGD